MPVLDYFSKDPDKRARFIFSFISGIYAKTDKNISKGFWASTKALEELIGIKNKTVLDIGSGTGAWSANFVRMGAQQVSGVDFVEKMVLQAQKKHPHINFTIGNGEDLSHFDDNSFDIVTASYVLHGMKIEKRERMLLEMKRISKKHVVVHDFIGKTPLFVRFLEFMEQSDYIFFKKNFNKEMKKHFINTRKTATRYGSGLYIGEIE
jgi:ubiquinone/menaquinone biosynthesis C-methylase UbiE